MWAMYSRHGERRYFEMDSHEITAISPLRLSLPRAGGTDLCSHRQHVYEDRYTCFILFTNTTTDCDQCDVMLEFLHRQQGALLALQD